MPIIVGTSKSWALYLRKHFYKNHLFKTRKITKIKKRTQNFLFLKICVMHLRVLEFFFNWLGV